MKKRTKKIPWSKFKSIENRFLDVRFSGIEDAINAQDTKKYKTKAKFNLANQIYSTFDITINSKYDVKINEKVLSRIKNTF